MKMISRSLLLLTNIGDRKDRPYLQLHSQVSRQPIHCRSAMLWVKHFVQVLYSHQKLPNKASISSLLSCSLEDFYLFACSLPFQDNHRSLFWLIFHRRHQKLPNQASMLLFCVEKGCKTISSLFSDILESIVSVCLHYGHTNSDQNNV